MEMHETNWTYLRHVVPVLQTYDFNTGETTWLVNKDGEVKTYVDCSDLFMWGCADLEEVGLEDISLLEKSLQDAKNANLKTYAGWLYCARKRNLQPMGARHKQHPEMKMLFENLRENWAGHYGDGTGENIEKPIDWDTLENPYRTTNTSTFTEFVKPENWKEKLKTLIDFVKFTRDTDELYDMLSWSVDEDEIVLHVYFTDYFGDKTLLKVDENSLNEIEHWYSRSEEKYVNPYEKYGHIEKYYETALLMWAQEKTGKFLNEETSAHLEKLLKTA